MCVTGGCVMGVASGCEIGGVGSLVMFGMVVVGMVMVAARVVNTVTFLFKTAIPVFTGFSESFFFALFL